MNIFIRTILYLVTLTLFILTGCMSKSAITQSTARSFAVKGEWETATALFLKDKKPTNAVDILLNRGLAHFEAGNYLDAEIELKRAYERIEEQFTKSVSRSAAAMITNDRTFPYDGTNFEKGMIHYYRGLNFIKQGNYDGFAIEGRALTNYLVQLPSLSKRKYNDDAFLRYIGGLGYEVANQYNDAWIAYKHSIENYPKTIGTIPQFVETAQMISAYRTGVVPLDSIRKAGINLDTKNKGRLVIFIESGIIAGLETNHITVPILEEDENRNYYDNNFNYDEYGTLLLSRYNDPYYGSRYRVKDWVHIAIPKIIHDGESSVTDVTIRSDSITFNAEMAHNSSAIFISEFEERFPAILARAFIRMILKRVAYNNAEKEGGQLAGILTRVVGEALETADTRSWTLLPDKIFVVDQWFPIGKHSIGLTLKNQSGVTIDQINLNEVYISPNQLTVLRVRAR